MAISRVTMRLRGASMVRHSSVKGLLGATAVAIIVLLNHPGAAEIKETVRLTINGATLAQPLLISDAPTLRLSNVFAGTFIGGPASAPPDDAATQFEIVFDVQTATGVKAKAYTVIFARSRWTNETLIYLPGRGDIAYRRNVSTILREGQDGRWHHASEAWADAVGSRLP